MRMALKVKVLKMMRPSIQTILPRSLKRQSYLRRIKTPSTLKPLRNLENLLMAFNLPTRASRAAKNSSLKFSYLYLFLKFKTSSGRSAKNLKDSQSLSKIQILPVEDSTCLRREPSTKVACQMTIKQFQKDNALALNLRLKKSISHWRQLLLRTINN